MNGSAEAIQVVGLHKKFGPLEVLKGVSLTARQGDVIAIIGGFITVVVAAGRK